MLIEDVLTEFKRTHLEHIEDIIITDGFEGGKAVVEYFRGLLLTLKAQVLKLSKYQSNGMVLLLLCVVLIQTTANSL